MLEVIVFAVAFTVSQVLAGIIMMKVLMSKKFWKGYSKKVVEIAKELEEAYEEGEL